MHLRQCSQTYSSNPVSLNDVKSDSLQAVANFARKPEKFARRSETYMSL
jgi:hypothetical protein